MESHSTLTLPRSVVLALWLRSPGSSPDTAEDALRAARAVQQDDEPHAVLWDGLTLELPELVARWSHGPREVCALLPAPGDLLGVPAVVSAAATDAGESVLVTTAEGSFAAVPEVTEFGSVYEPGHLVTWHVEPVPAWRAQVLGTVGTLSEAERELRTALLRATEALTALDVARWRDDAAEAIAELRSSADFAWPLPSTLDNRQVRVLSQAARLRAIVELATSDDGGTVNLWQADQRSTALREIDRSARRAASAATLHVDVPRD